MQKTYVRKHATQMTASELNVLEIVARGLCKEILSKNDTEILTVHAKEQTHRYSREIEIEKIKSCLRNFNQVVEFSYNYRYNDRRLVVRDSGGICLVLSSRCQNVVTVWHNAPSDAHKTLDESDYDRDMRILDFTHDGFCYNGLHTKDEVIADVIGYIFLGMEN